MLALAFAAVLPCGSAAAREIVIGVAAPLSGPTAILGKQVLDGAQAAALALTRNTIRLESVDDACTADGGRAAADRFVSAKADAVIGFLCTEALEAAMPILARANIPAITGGVRLNSLTDNRAKTGWPVFRLAPRADAERAAAAEIIPRLWRTEPFAIVDDGTIYGRELAESVRAEAERRALKPVFVDTFRPQLENQIGLVGRLARAGATHVFVGGDREDVAIMTRDASVLGVDLVFAGGESLRAARGEASLAAGTIMIGLPEWAEQAAPEIVEAIAAGGTAPEGYVLPAYAAVEIVEAAIRDHAEATAFDASWLSSRSFPTVLGTVGFDEKGDLVASPYGAFRFDGRRFVPLESQ